MIDIISADLRYYGWDSELPPFINLWGRQILEWKKRKKELEKERNKLIAEKNTLEYLIEITMEFINGLRSDVAITQPKEGLND